MATTRPRTPRRELPRRTHPTAGMRSRELIHLGKKIYGEDWRTKMAKEFGVDRVTVWRWASGRSTISVPIAIALRSKTL